MTLTMVTGAGFATATTSNIYIVGGSTGGAVPDVSRSTPPVMAGDQAYYWTRAWQADEAEALAEIEAGLAHRFTSPIDAIHWLLSEDDDD
jgi:hypothetical protein